MIPCHEFFSFRDRNGKCYGFRLSSFLALIDNGKETNPFMPTVVFEKEVIEQARFLSRVSVLLFDAKPFAAVRDKNLSFIESLKLKARSVFQIINSLGHMVRYEWLWSLDRYALKSFLGELWEVWYMRASLTDLDRHKIFKEHYTRFANYRKLVAGYSFNGIRRYTVSLIERFVTQGETKEDCNLGATYVLTALTLVNSQAARALPWLYESAQTNEVFSLVDSTRFDSLPITFQNNSETTVVMVSLMDTIEGVRSTIKEYFRIEGDIEMHGNNGVISQIEDIMNDVGIVFVSAIPGS